MFKRRRVEAQRGEKWSPSRCVRQSAEMSVSWIPEPSRRSQMVRGPMPASMSKTPAGERRIAAFPAEPLARIQSSRDIDPVVTMRGRSGRAQTRCGAVASLTAECVILRALLSRLLNFNSLPDAV